MLGAASRAQAGRCAARLLLPPAQSRHSHRLLITQDRDSGWRSADSVPAPSAPPPKAAAPGGGGDSTAAAAVAPTSRSAREQVLQALTDSRGMWVDSDAQTEVCVRVGARAVRACVCARVCLSLRVSVHICMHVHLYVQVHTHRVHVRA